MNYGWTPIRLEDIRHSAPDCHSEALEVYLAVVRRKRMSDRLPVDTDALVLLRRLRALSRSTLPEKKTS